MRLSIAIALALCIVGAPAQEVRDGLRDQGLGYARVVPGKTL